MTFFINDKALRMVRKKVQENDLKILVIFGRFLNLSDWKNPFKKPK
jgi:hypothetical protein